MIRVSKRIFSNQWEHGWGEVSPPLFHLYSAVECAEGAGCTVLQFWLHRCLQAKTCDSYQAIWAERSVLLYKGQNNALQLGNEINSLTEACNLIGRREEVCICVCTLTRRETVTVNRFCTFLLKLCFSAPPIECDHSEKQNVSWWSLEISWCNFGCDHHALLIKMERCCFFFFFPPHPWEIP